MRIFSGTPEGMTIVQNSFIDQYMPHANGEFVKVYLYLLRCADSGREISLSSIADVLEHTEKDIQRALAYWEKQQLLSVKTDSDGMLVSVTFLAPPAVETEKNLFRPGMPRAATVSPLRVSSRRSGSFFM